MKNINNSFELGKRIKKAREEAKLTQYKLHDLTGISITQISAYENGNRNIGLHSLYKIAVATGKTMDEIYGGSQESRPINNSKNKGELIVNCVSALSDEQVITVLPRQQENEFVSMGAEYYYRIGFYKYVDILDKMVAKLKDFEDHKEDYPDPDGFKKQIIAAAANQINQMKE